MKPSHVQAKFFVSPFYCSCVFQGVENLVNMEEALWRYAEEHSASCPTDLACASIRSSLIRSFANVLIGRQHAAKVGKVRTSTFTLTI